MFPNEWVSRCRCGMQMCGMQMCGMQMCGMQMDCGKQQSETTSEEWVKFFFSLCASYNEKNKSVPLHCIALHCIAISLHILVFGAFFVLKIQPLQDPSTLEQFDNINVVFFSHRGKKG